MKFNDIVKRLNVAFSDIINGKLIVREYYIESNNTFLHSYKKHIYEIYYKSLNKVNKVYSFEIVKQHLLDKEDKIAEELLLDVIEDLFKHLGEIKDEIIKI